MKYCSVSCQKADWKKHKPNYASARNSTCDASNDLVKAAKNLIKSARWEQAETVISQAYALDPNSHEVAVVMAIMAEHKGHFQGALVPQIRHRKIKVSVIYTEN